MASSDGLYAGFCEQLVPLLAANMVLQAQAGADCVALFDTAAGALDPAHFARARGRAAGATSWRSFARSCPRTPLIYYSRDTGPDHWQALRALDLQCLGVDWRHDLADSAGRQTPHWAMQGNLDPEWLLLPAAELEHSVRAVFRARRGAAGGGARGLGLRPGTRRVAAHAGRATCACVIRSQHEMFT